MWLNAEILEKIESNVFHKQVIIEFSHMLEITGN